MQPYLTRTLLCLALFSGAYCSEAPRCNDGIQNGDEEQTDCGGTCAPCYTCEDGIQNQQETRTDCGGPCVFCPDEWVQRPLPNAAAQGIARKIWFSENGQTGLLLHDYGLFRSTNGGQSWQSVALPGSGLSGFVRFFEMTGNQTGFLQLSDTDTRRSTDGGLTWQPINLPANFGVYDIAMSLDGQTGLLSMAKNSLNGTRESVVCRSTDGGLNWQPVFDSETWRATAQIPSSEPLDFRNLHRFTSGKAVAFSQRRRIESTDGLIWSAQPTDRGTPLSNAVWWKDETTAFMRDSLLDSPNYGQRLWRSTDGGRTWNAASVFTGARTFLHYENPNNLLAIFEEVHQYRDAQNRIYGTRCMRSTDDGQTWQPLGSHNIFWPYNQPLSVFAYHISPNFIAVAGNGGHWEQFKR